MKGATEILTKYWAKELGGKGLRCNVVAPGPVETDFNNAAIRSNPQMKERLASLSPLNRVGSAGDIGGVVAFLCTDEAGWINGQRIEVSGGISKRKGKQGPEGRSGFPFFSSRTTDQGQLMDPVVDLFVVDFQQVVLIRISKKRKGPGDGQEHNFKLHWQPVILSGTCQPEGSPEQNDYLPECLLRL